MNQYHELIQKHLDAGRDRFKTTCPLCSETRKNKADTCLSWLHTENRAVWNCHNCQSHGVLFLDGKYFKSSKPMPANRPDFRSKLMPADVSVMSMIKTDRGISAVTQQQAKVFGFTRAGQSWAAFPYYDVDGKVLSIKYRRMDAKQFYSEPGGMQVFYGLERVDPKSTLVIVEGEVDALSMLEAGVSNAVSVPGGAPSEAVTAEHSRKFDFLLHSKALIDSVPRIILAVDNDGPGQVLASELARRIGREKCYTVDWPEGCKDANDVLRAHGDLALRDLVTNARPLPVSGVYGLEDFESDFWRVFNEGIKGGESTGWSTVDELFQVVPGHLSIVTGTPGSGKSTVLDQMFVHLASRGQWNFGLCSFENDREIHAGHLAELFIGDPNKSFFPGSAQMSKEEASRGAAFVRNHFHFISFQDSDDLPTIDWILDKARALVLRHGIRGLVIDPYNYVQGITADNESKAISEMLTRVRMFAKTYQVHIWFVAHPTKLQRNKAGEIDAPKGNEISGSSAWWAKADLGITVHRTGDKTQVLTWKVRFRWLGKIGMAELNYNHINGSFSETGIDYRELPEDVGDIFR